MSFESNLIFKRNKKVLKHFMHKINSKLKIKFIGYSYQYYVHLIICHLNTFKIQQNIRRKKKTISRFHSKHVFLHFQTDLTKNLHKKLKLALAVSLLLRNY